jgi:ATP-dependent DNA ligase
MRPAYVSSLSKPPAPVRDTRASFLHAFLGAKPGGANFHMTRDTTPTSRVAAVSPMHPTVVREPFHRDGWVYEEKYDGWRMLAYKDGARVRLVSRNSRDLCLPFIRRWAHAARRTYS